MAKDKKPESIAEHVYTIPLRSAWIGTERVNRAKKSVSTIRRFIERHMHAKTVKISTQVNDALWSSGAKKPLAKIRVKATLDVEGIASVMMPGEITLDDEKKKFLEKPPEAGKEGAEKAKDATKEPEKEAEKAESKPEEKAVTELERPPELVKDAPKEESKAEEKPEGK